MSNTIKIKKDYFNNISKAIESLNNFFSSEFKNKNFPRTDDTELDGGVCSCIDSIESVDPRWITEPELADEAVNKINETKDELTEYSAERGEQNFFMFCDEKKDIGLSELGREYISFKALQKISDNFEPFEKLLNGIYSFELFTTPSAYKNEIDMFSDSIPVSECEDVLGNVSPSIFDPKKYINGLFENENIEFPENMTEEKELGRFIECRDLTDVNIVVDNSDIVSESFIQEAASTNYFENTKPAHIKYANGKWSISQQFSKTVNDLVAALRKCNTTDDLTTFFENDSKKYAKDLNDTVAPFILVQAMIKKGKEVGGFTKHADSYDSIISKNKGAKRFENYDIFTTFKADKEGTIKFIEDFCKLNLINDKKAVISNNTLLTLFNIFDSRIYFDILYNMIPDKEKKDNGMDEDSFVRTNRAKINKNSRSANPYSKDKVDEEADNTVQTSKEIKEYASHVISSFGDMSVSEMIHCEAWNDMIHEEINSLGDGLYNAGIPASAANEYIGETFDVVKATNKEIYMESVNSDTATQTVLGGLIGSTEITSALENMASPLTLIMFVNSCNLNTSIGDDIMKTISKKSRGKNIKAEILRDISSIVRALSKDADDAIDDYTIKDLKKRARSLADTLSFAMKRKDTFSDTEKENLIDLHHAVTKINASVDKDNEVKNAKVMKTFFKSADEVIKMITKISDEDILSEIEMFNSMNNNTEDIPDENNNEPETSEDEEPDEGETESSDNEDADSESNKSDESDKDDESDNDDDDDDDDDEPENIQETYKGVRPAYMETRIKNTDKTGGKTPTVEDTAAPSDDGEVPSNSIDDLTESIDEKIDDGGSELSDILGKEAKKEGSHIVYNVTNNYNYSNSFNKTSNDFSSNKTTDQSIHADTKANPESNNKYNSTNSSDPKEKKVVKEFSTGLTVERLFSILESSEPLLEASGAVKPKQDSLTKAMDRDRRKLPKQQAAKKSAEKAVSTAKAATMPIRRTKHWLLGIMDSLTERKEDKVKADIIKNPSYRTALYRAGRIALKAGLFGVFLTINGYLAAVYGALLASNAYDKQRLRKEVESEFATEVEILDKKIAWAEAEGTEEGRRDAIEMMRIRSKMERIASNEVTKTKIVHPSAAQ